jgi:hypothetical protein
VDSQQLATKVSQLESRVATLEDENKIVRGEVKQILTEIRTAILVRDNPFEAESSLASAAPAHMANTTAGPAPQVQEIHVHTPAGPEPSRAEGAQPSAKEERPVAQPPPATAPAREPAMLRSLQPPRSEHDAWSLMTIAGLSAWAEEAIARLGSLRFEILLDLCETAGHITPEARKALARVGDMEIAEPATAPSTNETLVILRQLDALLNDGDEDRARLYRAA